MTTISNSFPEDWKKSQPHQDKSHHCTTEGLALYEARYESVMPFHPPGSLLFPMEINGSILFQMVNRHFRRYSIEPLDSTVTMPR